MTDYLQLSQLLNIKGTLRNLEFRARCPLHDDQHPSFSINIKNGLWKCFSRCGSGDFVDLVQRIYNCPYQEAVQWINSNGTGNTLERLLPEFEQQLFNSGVFEVKQENPSWLLNYSLLNNVYAPQWFLDRGFSWDTINHWNIKYDQVWDAVVIPIHWKEELVGTVTRNRIKEPKYENSPNLPRSEILWCEISRLRNKIIICEGALDQLWLWQLGYNSIGLLGTDISQKQIELIKQLPISEITLALDNDEAGKLGTQKAIDTLTRSGWLLPQLTKIKFPEGIKDPQDCDEALLKKLYEERIPAAEFFNI